MYLATYTRLNSKNLSRSGRMGCHKWWKVGPKLLWNKYGMQREKILIDTDDDGIHVHITHLSLWTPISETIGGIC
jgi:hypothetical protein